jgi:CDGSH-type Zn-finger protein
MQFFGAILPQSGELSVEASEVFVYTAPIKLRRKVFMGKEPIVVNENPGTVYYCLCGKTKNAPYCDGSHEGTGCKPYELKVEKKQEVHICTCGETSNSPFCDGSHLNC